MGPLALLGPHFTLIMFIIKGLTFKMMIIIIVVFSTFQGSAARGEPLGCGACQALLTDIRQAHAAERCRDAA